MLLSKAVFIVFSLKSHSFGTFFVQFIQFLINVVTNIKFLTQFNFHIKLYIYINVKANFF